MSNITHLKIKRIQEKEDSKSEVKEKLEKFASSKGISSSDYYGKPETAQGESRIEKAKEVGITLISSAKESAKGVYQIFEFVLDSNYGY